VLISSDHGGKGHGHGRNSLEEIRIPWILSGPGIQPGQLAAAVYTFDTAATIAMIFGLDAPACWVGRPVTTAFQSVTVTARSVQKDAAGHTCVTDSPIAIAVNNGSNNRQN
jgi:arylsulfatase A-like enzyme